MTLRSKLSADVKAAQAKTGPFGVDQGEDGLARGYGSVFFFHKESSGTIT